MLWFIYCVLVIYLVLFECSVDQERGLFIYSLSDRMSHSIVRLQANIE